MSFNANATTTTFARKMYLHSFTDELLDNYDQVVAQLDDLFNGDYDKPEGQLTTIERRILLPSCNDDLEDDVEVYSEAEIFWEKYGDF